MNISKVANNIMEDQARSWLEDKAFYEKTPYVIVNELMKFPKAVRQGRIQILKDYPNKGKDMINYHSTLYELSLVKPVVKLPKNQNIFTTIIEDFDNQIADLKKQREEYVKKEWKKAVKPFWHEHTINRKDYAGKN